MSRVYRPYAKGVFNLLNRNVNYVGDTIKVCLLNSTYVPNALTHAALSDVVAHEVTGNAQYARQTLGGKTITQTEGVVGYSAAAVSFGSNVSISARYAVIYADLAGANSGKWLLGYIDLNEGGTTNIASINQVFEVQFPTPYYTITP